MDLDITMSDIEKCIEIRKEDKFLVHFFTAVSGDRRQAGEIKKKEIRLWRFNLWNGGFYPVFIFKLNLNNRLVSITSKLNSFGKLLFALPFIFPVFVLMKINYAEITLFGTLFLILFYVTFGLIYVLIAFKIYSFERKEELKNIYKTLNNIMLSQKQ